MPRLPLIFFFIFHRCHDVAAAATFDFALPYVDTPPRLSAADDAVCYTAAVIDMPRHTRLIHAMPFSCHAALYADAAAHTSRCCRFYAVAIRLSAPYASCRLCYAARARKDMLFYALMRCQRFTPTIRFSISITK